MIVRAKGKHLNSLCVFMSYLDARVMNANTTVIFCHCVSVSLGTLFFRR